MAVPTTMIAVVPDLDPFSSMLMAERAVAAARFAMPRGWSVKKRITPVYGEGYFGVAWQDAYLWYQERGIKAFTMRSLKGKTIPMWVRDFDGKLAAANPKIQRRREEDGSEKVLIFRKATNPGQRGRIAKRDEKGRIQKGNIGVKWRHPGLEGGDWIYDAIHNTARDNLRFIIGTYAYGEDGFPQRIERD